MIDAFVTNKKGAVVRVDAVSNPIVLLPDSDYLLPRDGYLRRVSIIRTIYWLVSSPIFSPISGVIGEDTPPPHTIDTRQRLPSPQRWLPEDRFHQ